MILSVTQCVWYLTKGIWDFSFFSYPTAKALSGVLGRYESGHTCITCIAKSKTRPQGDASHTLWSSHASVWNFLYCSYSKYFCTPCIMTLSFWWMPLFESMDYLISFFSFLPFFGQASKYSLFYSLDTCPFFSHAPWHEFFSLFLA
jgi:hypothetical protein